MVKQRSLAVGEEIAAAIAGALIFAGLGLFALWRWFYGPRPKRVYVPAHRIIRYGARYKGEREPWRVYPSAAAAANDPLWANPGRSHTVGQLCEVAEDGWTLRPVSEWSRTYANDIKALRRED